MDASRPGLVSIEGRVIWPLGVLTIYSIQVLTQMRAEIPNVSPEGLKTSLLEIILIAMESSGN